MKYICLLSILGLFYLSCSSIDSDLIIDDVSCTRLIYQGNTYAAFTDLISYNNKLYCAFRDGDSHVEGRNGSIIIIESSNLGVTWSISLEISEERFDLRDPCFVVGETDNLYISYFGVNHEAKTYSNYLNQLVFSSDNKLSCMHRNEIQVPSDLCNYILWHHIYQNGVFYTVAYDHVSLKAKLCKSEDGVSYSVISEINNTIFYDGISECALLFKNDTTLCMAARVHSNEYSLYGESKYPYNNWKFKQLPFILGGPKLKQDTSGIYLCSRSRQGLTLYKYNSAINHYFYPIYDTYRKGDTGYPGIVFQGNKLFISYYLGNIERHTSDIYLISIDNEKLIIK